MARFSHRRPIRGIAGGLLIVLAAVPCRLSAQPPAGSELAAAPEIRLRVTGLRSDRGRLVCGLFTESNWLRAGAIPGKGGEIEQGVAVCTFRGVEPGSWAISTFHDENGDGRLNTGFMRIPKEGTAASNNAYRRFGPPRYRDARFDYPGGVLELEARMRHIGGRGGE